MKHGKYSEKERENRRLASRNWKRRNKEHVAKALAKWIKKNSAHRKEYMAAYNATRKERQRAYDAERYKRPENIAKRFANKERRKAYMKEFRNTHAYIWQAVNAARKAIKRGNTVDGNKLISQWVKHWRSKSTVICYWCGKRVSPYLCHSDHITPLANGGRHSIDNLCISCGHCNRKKHDKPIDKWNAEIDQPVLIGLHI